MASIRTICEKVTSQTSGRCNPAGGHYLGEDWVNIPIWAACLYEPDKASQRMAFNGYCLVLVQSNKQAGEIRLKVQSETLKGDEVIVKVQ